MELGEDDGSEESKAQFVERSLRSKLPDYIVNCLLVAGFDPLRRLADRVAVSAVTPASSNSVVAKWVKGTPRAKCTLEAFGGIIPYNEWAVYFECIGIDVKHARLCFDALDTNKDGELSRSEFVDETINFHCCTDESHPSRFAYGPI
eukprot:Em0010g234a